MEGVNVVFYIVAKHIDIVESIQFELVKTNVIRSQNIINVCHEIGAELTIGIGTDKTVAPLNVYDATKILMEKMLVSASNYVDRKYILQNS